MKAGTTRKAVCTPTWSARVPSMTGAMMMAMLPEMEQ
jgi:hypothetical protein